MVYRTLRDYQDGKFNPPHVVGTRIGMLDGPLTEVYDTIVTAIKNREKTLTPR